MRVGIFTECYEPVLNGVVISIKTFRQALEQRGHQYYIFTTGYPDHKESDPCVFRYPILIPSRGKGGRFPIAGPRLIDREASKIEKLNLDLIHCQHLLGLEFSGISLGVGILGLHVARVLRSPAILTYHTLLTDYAHYLPLLPKSWTKRLLIWASRKYSNAFDQVVTPSPSMKRLLRSWGVIQPIEPIPTGVELADFQNPYPDNDIRSKWQIPKDKKILLYVSRVAKEKNVDFLFEVIRDLARKRKDWHLLMVGGGPELGRYQKLVEQWNLQGSVTFTDMLPKREVNRCYGRAYAFVFPSTTETQGIVFTEAMAAGVPPIGINVMGPTDIIKDGIDGFLTPPTKEAYLSRIEQLLDDNKLRKKMGQQAQKNAQQFSVDASADKMENLYERTISHHRS